MVNIRSYGVGALCLGIGLLVGPEAQAGLPTFDAANISGTISIVKNGAKNLQGISEITGKVGELNTIVGDAAASVSKFQSEYGDKINEGIEMGKKAMARKAEAEAALADHKAAIQEQKDMYQAAMDSVAQKNEQNSDYQEPEQEPEEDFAEETQYMNTGMQAAQVADMEQVGLGQNGQLMTSADRVYADPGAKEAMEDGEEFIDGVPDAIPDGVPGDVAGDGQALGMGVVKPATGNIVKANSEAISAQPTAQPAVMTPASGNVVKAGGATVSAQPAVMRPATGASVQTTTSAQSVDKPTVMKPVSGATTAAVPATGVIQNATNSERKVFRKAVRLPSQASASAPKVVAPSVTTATKAVMSEATVVAPATTANTGIKLEKATLTAADRKVAPTQMEVQRPTEVKTTSPVQRRQFRTAPRLNRVERVSSNTYRQSSKMAFASASESEGTGNSYIGNVYVVPLAARCEISAEKFVNDETARKNCVEKVVRENNADNSFDSALSMKDCRKMVYDMIVALLAEATNSKYEAANYSKTLDEQDKLAGDSTDVRGDLTVIAMSNQQTQLLLNRLSMSYSSLIILESVEQLCSANKDVLGDSDLDEDKK